MTTLTVWKGVWRDLRGGVSLWGVLEGGEDGGEVPAVDVLLGREPGALLARLAGQPALEVEELLGEDLVLEEGEPAHVERVDLELEELALLGRQAVHPLLLVELGGEEVRGGGGGAGAGLAGGTGTGGGLRGGKEGHDVAILFGLFGVVPRGLVRRLSLESRHYGCWGRTVRWK